MYYTRFGGVEQANRRGEKALTELGSHHYAKADGAVGQKGEEKKNESIVELVDEEPTDHRVGLLLVASL
jgi:hypothetical protein